jgi:IS30 family transposase
MAQPKFTLYKYVKLANGSWRYCNAAFYSSGKIKPNRCLVGGKRPRKWKTERFLGHWEADLLSGAKNSYIATLVERHSRFAMLIKVSSKDTEVVVATALQYPSDAPLAFLPAPPPGSGPLSD